MFYKEGEDLVAIGNSIRLAYGLKTYHASYKPLDEELQKRGVPQKRKLCVILLDGFGSTIQFEHRKAAPFIYAHRKFKITSVFPPTTVAATTSLLTGFYPKEDGWMGWTQKFPFYDKPITMFPSTFIGGTIPSPKSSWDEVPLRYIDGDINKYTSYKANRIMGFSLEPANAEHVFSETERLIPESDFIYSYWIDPDMSMHEYGNYDPKIDEVLADLDMRVKKLVESHPEVTFVLLADHGHIDQVNLSIYEHPDLTACLKYPDFGLESRAACFYVKEDKMKEFNKLAHKYYGKDFYIFSKKQVDKLKIFGVGTPNKYYDYFAGDYLLVSKSNKGLIQSTTAVLKSQHAGGTARERFVNVSLYN
jgi:hypothetical protein